MLTLLYDGAPLLQNVKPWHGYVTPDNYCCMAIQNQKFKIKKTVEKEKKLTGVGFEPTPPK